MTAFVRCALCLAALFPASSLLADDGNVRVAVIVDMTPEGRKVARPTPDHPVYYLPVTVGYKELGDHLQDYQRPPPPAGEVESLLAKALADQGYRSATKDSPPSLVLVSRWGYIAPEIVMGHFANRPEMMTYLVGDNWRAMSVSRDPTTQELISDIDNSLNIQSDGHERGTELGSATKEGARYFLLVSALDFQASQQHKSVLLWRAHVSINYWGHYLDETLPTLIAAGAPMFGRETNRPQMTTAPVVPLGHVVVGTPEVVKYFQGVPVAPVIVNSDRLQADTEKTLTQFADRAESDMMEPPDLVTGHTDFAATQGTPAGAPETPRGESPDGAIRLPPFIVADTRSHVRWHYAAVPGFEILSCCSTVDTERFAEGIYRQQAWLNQMVPPDLQARNSGPTTFILLNDAVEKGMSRDIATLTKTNSDTSSGEPAEAGGPSPLSSSLIPLPQIQLSDEDSLGADIIFKSQEGLILEFDPDYVFFMLTKRTPPLPTWFTAGMLNLYRARVAGDATGDNNSALRSDSVQRPGSDKLIFPAAGWISPEVTAFLGSYHSPWSHRWQTDLPRSLLPMGVLLTEPPPPASTDDDKLLWLLNLGVETPEKPDPDQQDARAELIIGQGAKKDSPWLRDIWMSQAALFVRWALDDDTSKRRESLWKFAERASLEPVTETMFRDCFGLSFEEMDQRLIEYLPKAVIQSLILVPQAPLDNPWVEPRDPTEAEKARILGDWQRKEIDFVKASHPEYVEKYATQANLTLLRAYNDGERDPGLLAAIGLYECSVGNDDRAQYFLEAAVRAQVARPRAYVELARIRLSAALAKPTGAGGRLDPDQVASVLDLLRATGSLQPPQLAAFLLAADAWKNAAVMPTRGDLHLLDEGLYFFPDQPRLIVATAQLDAQAGLGPEAIRVLDRGLQKISDPALRHLFLTLRTRYTAGTQN